MKKKIELIRFFRDGQWRIGLRHDNDPEVTAAIRQLPSAVYSGTQRCWHMPENSDSLSIINKQLSGKYIIDTARLDLPDDSAVFAPPVQRPTTRVVVDEEENTKSPVGEDFNPLIAGVTKPERMVVKATPDEDAMLPNARGITARAKQTKPTVDEDPNLPSEKEVLQNTQVRKCRVEIANVAGTDQISVKFHGFYDREWIQELQQYGKVEYFSDRKEWRLPHSRMAIDSLSDYFASRALEVDVRRNIPPKGIKKRREEISALVRERELSAKAIEAVQQLGQHIKRRRYSNSTLTTYSSMLQLFLQYFSEREPQQITDNDIADFMTDYVIDLGYSASWQNQMITAIKTYYLLNDRIIRSDNIIRPKRGRSLPKVFSKEEIRRILNATHNFKHRLILWMIYSCGLRRSEVLNIRLSDLDRDRSILHIREGKGKVDRVVPVSDKVWDKLDEYVAAYAPATWLFEGQAGGKYSGESVYNLFRTALKRAGIRKEVGVHALRHSYATHLHENGLDIRFIQELLGHRNSRTTEIYTHVSRRNLLSVKSPIDDIDIK
jgi:integrase/recombinase XerD